VPAAAVFRAFKSSETDSKFRDLFCNLDVSRSVSPALAADTLLELVQMPEFVEFFTGECTQIQRCWLRQGCELTEIHSFQGGYFVGGAQVAGTDYWKFKN
jgi:hypothetical protein